jgi:hypothetical protein
MKKSCQENKGIKTGLESNEEKLSRKRRNHDRFGSSLSNFVRIYVYLDNMRTKNVTVHKELENKSNYLLQLPTI